MSINSEEYCLHLYTCIYLYINDWSVMCLKILHTGMCGIKFLVNARNLFNLYRFRISIQLYIYTAVSVQETKWLWILSVYLNLYKITDAERNCVCCYTNPKHLFIFAFLYVCSYFFVLSFFRHYTSKHVECIRRDPSKGRSRDLKPFVYVRQTLNNITFEHIEN